MLIDEKALMEQFAGEDLHFEKSNTKTDTNNSNKCSRQSTSHVQVSVKSRQKFQTIDHSSEKSKKKRIVSSLTQNEGITEVN